MNMMTLAHELGIGLNQVYRCRRRGMPTDSVAAARAWRAENLDLFRSRGEPGDPQPLEPCMVPTEPLPALTPTETPLPSILASRQRRAFHEANLSSIRERQKCGELVELQAVEKSNADIYTACRLALLRIPDKLAERLAAESDPFVCRTLVVAEIEQTLADLAAALNAMAENFEAENRTPTP